MELKEYQQTALVAQGPLEAVDLWRARMSGSLRLPGQASQDFPLKAWEAAVKTTIDRKERPWELSAQFLHQDPHGRREDLARGQDD